jgi:transcriptional regulator with XRE-family HTH domain
MDITLERILSLIPRKPDGSFVHGAKAQFADTLGMARNLVTMWESGQSQSYRNKLHEIAAKYNVSVEWLKGETDEKTPPADTESERAKLLASLENMTKEELIDFVAKAMEVMKNK